MNTKKPYYVYIVLCSDNTLYSGITTDLKRRIEDHNIGSGAKYTRGRLPVRILHSERLNSKSDALKREIQIKKWSRKEKINNLHLKI